jgi:hypothetical protein
VHNNWLEVYLKMKNKRGQVAFVLILGVALALCLAGLYIFVSFKGGIENKSKQTSIMISESAFVYQYIIETCKFIGEKAIASKSNDLELEFQRIASEEEKYKSESVGNFYDKVKSEDINDFLFIKTDGGYLLVINGLVSEARQADNSITKNFNLKMVFDNSGKFEGVETTPFES